MDLTDQQWTIIEPLFEEKRRPDGRGRPWRDARAVLNIAGAREIGRSRTRIPVALWVALAMAAAVPTMPTSPMPVDPSG